MPKNTKAELPERGGFKAQPSEEYYRETLGIGKLTLRLKLETLKRLATMAGKKKGARGDLITELIDERWEKRRGK